MCTGGGFRCKHPTTHLFKISRRPGRKQPPKKASMWHGSLSTILTRMCWMLNCSHVYMYVDGNSCTTRPRFRGVSTSEHRRQLKLQSSKQAQGSEIEWTYVNSNWWLQKKYHEIASDEKHILQPPCIPQKLLYVGLLEFPKHVLQHLSSHSEFPIKWQVTPDCANSILLWHVVSIGK